MHLPKPGKVLKSFNWIFSGKPVEKPCTYISGVLIPSGSKKIWCESLSANLTILSSIDGQYLGPLLSIKPP